MRTALVVALALWWRADALAGQVLRGRVVDDVSGSPVVAAVVELVGDDDGRLDAFLTEPDGSYVLRAPGAGRYRVRLQRLGYRTVLLGPFEVPPRRAAFRELRLQPAPVQLRGITAEGARRCVVNPRTGAQTAVLWDEARKVLTTTALVQERELIRLEAARYRRTLDPERTALTGERIGVGVLTRPFRSPPPEQLVDSGFVQAVGDSTAYYMPDPDAILSDVFLASHCFHIARRRGPEGRFVGLAFRPLAGRRAPDVSGVLWLEEEDGALSSLEYRYVGLADEAWEERSGGRAEFEQLGTGHWIVRRWSIRMPLVQERSRFLGLSKRMEMVGVIEEGGEVLAAYGPGGRLVSRHHAHRLRGVVRDSLSGGPLAGAKVRLSGTLRLTESDEDGAFVFDALPPGEYVATFHHPLLDTLGARSPARVVRVPADEAVRLALPSGERVVTAACPGLGPDDPRGSLLGRVTDSATGRPPSARVEVLVRSGGGGRRSRELDTDPDGYFRVCGVSPGSRIEVVARDEAGRSARGEARVGAHGFARIDLDLGGGGRPDSRNR